MPCTKSWKFVKIIGLQDSDMVRAGFHQSHRGKVRPYFSQQMAFKTARIHPDADEQPWSLARDQTSRTR